MEKTPLLRYEETPLWENLKYSHYLDTNKTHSRKTQTTATARTLGKLKLDLSLRYGKTLFRKKTILQL
jgi:hypothetical protein